jgi:hypothetical protein
VPGHDPLGEPDNLIGAFRIECGGVLVEQQKIGPPPSAPRRCRCAPGSASKDRESTIESASSVSITSTGLVGGPVNVVGWVGCMCVWDENSVFYANTCPQ